MKLNLGCGQDYRDGWLNVDIDPTADADWTYDIEAMPWPWNDDRVHYILMDNVLEHVHPRSRTAVINECHRVLAADGKLCIRLPVPEVGSGWDLTHFSVPSWRWPYHPDMKDDWSVLSISSSAVGPGRFLPNEFGRFLTRHGVARCVDEVEVVVTCR